MGRYPAALGVAYTWYSVPAMIIFEADMVINRDYAWSAATACPTGLSDVQNVVTVMHDAGIIRQVARLRPMICIKG